MGGFVFFLDVSFDKSKICQFRLGLFGRLQLQHLIGVPVLEVVSEGRGALVILESLGTEGTVHLVSEEPALVIFLQAAVTPGLARLTHFGPVGRK